MKLQVKFNGPLSDCYRYISIYKNNEKIKTFRTPKAIIKAVDLVEDYKFQQYYHQQTLFQFIAKQFCKHEEIDVEDYGNVESGPLIRACCKKCGKDVCDK